jgi:hypothetical protein
MQPSAPNAPPAKTLAQLIRAEAKPVLKQAKQQLFSRLDSSKREAIAEATLSR